MLTWIVGLLTNKWFWIFYMIPSYAILELGLRSLNPVWPKNEEDIERDKKYSAFAR